MTTEYKTEDFLPPSVQWRENHRIGERNAELLFDRLTEIRSLSSNALGELEELDFIATDICDFEMQAAIDSLRYLIGSILSATDNI